MIRGIHYFSTELKTKIDVIPRGCFKADTVHAIVLLMCHTHYTPTQPETPVLIDNTLPNKN